MPQGLRFLGCLGMAAAITSLVMAAGAQAQSPMTTVLDKSSARQSEARTQLAAQIARCDLPRLPAKLGRQVSLLSSWVLPDRIQGREIALRFYRFSHSLDQVLPLLAAQGVKLQLESPADLLAQAPGTVWHGYNEMDGLEATNELTCGQLLR